MKNILIITSLILAFALTSHATALSEGWVADFDEAVKLAKEQDKDLFVDFTGSDWCGWCIKLNEEVFSHEEFLKPARDKFILVALDYPNSEEAKAKVPNPERNAELSEEYNIRGFPTCLLIDVNGEVFGRMGYQPGGPEQYIKDMTQKAEEGKKLIAEVKELKKTYKDAKDKTPVIEKAITLLNKMDPDSPGVKTIAEMVMNAFKLDPDNAAGLKLKAVEALLESGQADEKVNDLACKMDPQNESGLFEKVVMAKFALVRDDTSCKDALKSLDELNVTGNYKDPDTIKGMIAQAALWCEFLKDPDRGVAYATKADSMDGEIDDSLQTKIDEILEK